MKNYLAKKFNLFSSLTILFACTSAGGFVADALYEDPKTAEAGTYREAQLSAMSDFHKAAGFGGGAVAVVTGTLAGIGFVYRKHGSLTLQ